MVSIYKHINGQFSLLEDFENGSWINLVAPTNEELNLVSQKTGADIDLLHAALDEEERSRIELEEEINQTIMVVDIPRVRITSYNVCYTKLLRFSCHLFWYFNAHHAKQCRRYVG